MKIVMINKILKGAYFALITLVLSSVLITLWTGYVFISQPSKSSDITKDDYFYPRIVHIESQATCNAKCSFCDYTSLKRIGSKLTDNEIEKILQDLSEIPKEHYFTIQPYKISEPFLEPRLPNLVKKYLKFHDSSEVSIISNANYLPSRIIDSIFSCSNRNFGYWESSYNKISRIRLAFSLNEIEKDKYESLMKLSFTRTIKNLQELHKRVSSENIQIPIDISRVSTDPLGDKLFQEYVNENFPLFKPRLLKINDWMSTNDFSNEHPLLSKLPVKAFKRLSCQRWSDLSIMASGDLALCCMDSGKINLDLGNIKSNNCLELYRRKIKRFIPKDSERGSSPYPCNVCSYRQGNDLEIFLFKFSMLCEKVS